MYWYIENMFNAVFQMVYLNDYIEYEILPCNIKSRTLIIILVLGGFSNQFKLVDFYWSKIDCESLKVSRTLLSILADFNSAVVGIVSILSLASNSPPIFFSSLARSTYLSDFSLSFIFTVWSVGKEKNPLNDKLFFPC